MSGRPDLETWRCAECGVYVDDDDALMWCLPGYGIDHEFVRIDETLVSVPSRHESA